MRGVQLLLEHFFRLLDRLVFDAQNLLEVLLLLQLLRGEVGQLFFLVFSLLLVLVDLQLQLCNFALQLLPLGLLALNVRLLFLVQILHLQFQQSVALLQLVNKLLLLHAKCFR